MLDYIKNDKFIKAAFAIVVFLVAIIIVLKLTPTKKESKPDADKEEMIEITDPNVIKNQVVDGIDFTETLFVVQNKKTRLLVQVTNNTEEDYTLKEYNIIIKDKDGKVLATLPGYIGELLSSHETKVLNATIDKDLRDVAEIVYEVVK